MSDPTPPTSYETGTAEAWLTVLDYVSRVTQAVESGDWYYLVDKSESLERAVKALRGRPIRYDRDPRQERLARWRAVDPDEFRLTPTRIVRTPPARVTAMDAEIRRRWRALAMAIKAKLEVVATGISTFEEEWLAHIVLPDGALVRDHVLPRVEQAYVTGEVPPMLPGGSPSRAIESAR